MPPRPARPGLLAGSLSLPLPRSAPLAVATRTPRRNLGAEPRPVDVTPPPPSVSPAVNKAVAPPTKTPTFQLRDKARNNAGAKLLTAVDAQTPGVRSNPVGIQMLPPELHSQLFPPPLRAPHPEQVYTSRRHLRRHGLEGRTTSRLSDPAIKLPKLVGNTIEEHLRHIGMEQSMPYRAMVMRFAKVALPPVPKKWDKTPGWTRYAPDGTKTPVEAPLESDLVFDVETVVQEGPLPVIACAASSQAWYGWVSPCLFAKDEEIENMDIKEKLISLGSRKKARIVVGHNVGYDRARTWEEYHIEGTRAGWIDTMSLHSAVGGLSSQQRGIWLAHQKKAALAPDHETDEDLAGSGSNFVFEGASNGENVETPAWIDTSSMSSLEWVTQLYLKKKLDKAPRDVFVTGTLEDVREDFQMLFQYCATDVVTTHEVFRIVLPKFLQKCPHPISFAGMLAMGSAFLPTDQRWHRYAERAEEAYRSRVDDVEARLLRLAEKAIEDHMEDGSWASDPWLRHLDWDPVELKTNRETSRSLVVRGKPHWYADLWESSEQRIRLTTSKRVVPYLLRLQWRGYPLYYSAKIGWTYRMPFSDADKIGKATPIVFTDDPEDPRKQAVYDLAAMRDVDGIYLRIPHKDGDGSNVGNPLSKSYIQAFEDGVLSSEYPEAKQILKTNAECAYWIGNRQRVAEQFVIRSTKPDREDETVNELGYPLKPDDQPGAIIPQVVTMGTITRRAVEKTWMTASNAKKNRIGSELKAQIAAPPGYHIVGADVDSQELWIASLLGDKQVGMHGGTAIGWMTLQGTKAEGTDVHSRTAQILGINRDQAKVFNYSRIYGAGIKHTKQLLMQFNPDISEEEAQKKASDLFADTKGKTSSHELKGIGGANIFLRRFHFGGTESFVFNQMEEVAADLNPRTPVLGCEIPDALMPQNVKNQYLTSRVNWVVQSSGVDYLHILLASVSYLSYRFGIKCRLMITIHDELRFLVADEDKHRAALALQIANLWTRSIFASAVGIDDLPLVGFSWKWVLLL